VHECPEFDEKGVCTDKKCKLPHIERAGRRRMAAAAAAASKPTVASGNDSTADSELPNGAEDSDPSSEDEGEAIDSDDVDSDALSGEEGEEGEEGCFIQSDDTRKNSHEVTQQLDFIHF